ncbi:MAG TPA: efflux RND transporter permease subunit [Fibrobacteraceae bacterium]|nr:efflux RND transporter permease subunit [Fibrobacteraceae bacterium]
MNLSEISIKRPTLVVVIFTILVFLGAISYKSLSYELLPEFNLPYFVAVVTYPGASPTEVENSVTKKLEETLSSVPGTVKLRSYSMENQSVVLVELEQGTNVDASVNEGYRLVKSVQAQLPDDVLEPSVMKINMNSMPIMVLGVNADLPSTELYDLLHYRIIPDFSSISGVGSVTMTGAEEREIQVNVDPAKLAAHNISLLQVVSTIQNNNLNFPAGKVKADSTQSTIRLSAKYGSIEEIAGTVIQRYADGSLLKVGDVAEVVDAVKDPSGYYRVNGQPAVGIYITKQDGANTVAISDQAYAKIAKLEKQYSNVHLKFQVPGDGSVFIREAAHSVTFDLLAAIIFVTILMVFFLHSARNGLIVMISVPLSVITAFIGMYVMGFSLNIITLLALSLMIGTLVDDAIVVLENIYRHMEMGKSAWQASIDGIKEIGLSVTSITLVLLVVFLPVALTNTMVSPIFRAFSLTIVVSVIISLLVAFTAVPLLTSRIGKLEHIEKRGLWGTILYGFEVAVTWTRTHMLALLRLALRHRKTTLLLALVALVSSVALFPLGFIGSEMAATGDQGEIQIDLEYPKDISLEQNNAQTRRIEADILQMPEIVNAYTGVAQSSTMLSGTGSNFKAQIKMKLVPKEKRHLGTDAIATQLERKINSTYPGVKAIAHSIGMISSEGTEPLQVVIQGTNRDSVLAFANRMRDSLALIPGTKNLKLSTDLGSPEVVVHVDREKMARLGLDLGSVGGALQYAFSGNQDAQLLVGDYEYDINVRMDGFNRKSAEDVANLVLQNHSGATVKLKQFAEVSEGLGPNQLERYARMPSIIIKGYTEGRSLGDIGKEVTALLDRNVTQDISYATEGNLKSQGEAFSSLFLALIVSIFLVYLIMVALYESYLYPFVVLFSIPLAVIGAIWALALAGENLSMFSLLGMIMLVGLVAKNAILVVDFTNQIKKETGDTHKALLQAVEVRFRPILMTAMATIVGMLPIALSSGAGSEWKSGIGWVLIGGMASSMFLSLIVVPVVYSVLENFKQKIWALKQRQFLIFKSIF